MLRAFLAATLLAATPLISQAAGEKVTLANQGKATMPIIIAQHPADLTNVENKLQAYGQRDLVNVPVGETVEAHARDLADMLGRITGGKFEITRSNKAGNGIILGLYTDFPELNLADRFNPQDSFRTEEYLLQTHEGKLYVIGATTAALQHAVSDLLFTLGHRQFFPGQTWEIVPSSPTLDVALDRFEKPSYHSRLIWYGSGMQDFNAGHYEVWARRNRIGAGFSLNTSHEYNAIRKRNAEAFKNNPHFLAQIDGEHKEGAHAKFNVADPGLQKLVAEDALQWFKDNPNQISKTMDPSDFGGWSNTGPSAALGEGTNQALTLANLVAKAINENSPKPRYVGMYAYYQHQLPPTIEVDPHIIISFATRFLRPGVTVDTLIDGWKKQGLKQLGIREYYSVYMWDWGMPDLSLQGGDLGYLQYTIPHFYNEGARFLTSESSDASGPIGLGHYVASRLLWNVDEAKNLDQIVDDFLEKSFGPAKEPMGRFYALINGHNRTLLQYDMVHQMYSILAEARQVQGLDAATKQRIDELVLYTRYVELMRDYLTLRTANQQPRQEAFEAVIKHAYRMHKTMMIHVTAMYARNFLARFDKTVTIPKEAQWAVPADRNPWKDETPFAQAEIESYITNGLQRPRVELSHITFTKGKPAKNTRGKESLRARDGITYLVHADKAGKVSLTVDSSPVGITWAPAWHVTLPATGQDIARGRLELDGETTISFDAPAAGVYAVFIEPTVNSTRVTSDHPLGIVADSPSYGRGYLHGYKTNTRFYFHIPAGLTETYVQVMGQGKGEFVKGTLYDPNGKEVESNGKINGEEPHRFVIKRPANAPAEVWSVHMGPPTDGYFEDGYILLSPDLVPVVTLRPDAVFTLTR